MGDPQKTPYKYTVMLHDGNILGRYRLKVGDDAIIPHETQIVFQGEVLACTSDVNGCLYKTAFLVLWSIFGYRWTFSKSGDFIRRKLAGFYNDQTGDAKKQFRGLQRSVRLIGMNGMGDCPNTLEHNFLVLHSVDGKAFAMSVLCQIVHKLYTITFPIDGDLLPHFAGDGAWSIDLWERCCVKGEELPFISHGVILSEWVLEGARVLDAELNAVPGLARAYCRTSKGLVEHGPGTPTVGDGGVCSSLHDLTRLHRSLATKNNVLSPESIHLMFSPGRLRSGAATPRGMGVYVTEFEGTLLHVSQGSDAGFRHVKVTLPQYDVTVLILTNASIPEWALHAVARFLLSKMVGEQMARLLPD